MCHKFHTYTFEKIKKNAPKVLQYILVNKFETTTIIIILDLSNYCCIPFIHFIHYGGTIAYTQKRIITYN